MKTQTLLKISCNSILLLAFILGTGVAPVLAVRSQAPITAVSPLVACSNLTFAAPTTHGVVVGPSNIEVGDFNADGHQDLATTHGTGGGVSILLGNGTGSFSAATRFTTADAATFGIVVVDVNGDSKQDLVIASWYSEGNGALQILLGDGAGSFGPASVYPAGSFTSDLALGDFNSDSKQDVAFTSAYSNISSAVGIAIGNGGGEVAGFNYPPTFFPLAPDTGPGTVAVGDFNGDGKQDLVTGNVKTTASISILLGNGTGNFGAPTYVSTGYRAHVAVGDFNGDGKQDLAATDNSSSSNTVSVLLGNGTGTFSAPAHFTVGTVPNAVVVGDFNGDGKQDLAVTSFGSDIVSILLGNGMGSFGAAMNLPTGGTDPLSLTLGDFNGDGRQDLAVTNFTSKTVSILLNTCQAVPSQTFADVPMDYWAWSFIENLYAAGITGGCGTNPLRYCPEGLVTRAEMAVFLERGIHGSSYTPPPVGGSTGFGDVPTAYWAAAFIKQLATEGITLGCGSGNYCPESPVTRAEMAVFLLRSRHGASYVPPAVGSSTGFSDVPITHWAAAWIKQLASEGITEGCSAGNYCPESPATRAEMAVFLVRAFGLTP